MTNIITIDTSVKSFVAPDRSGAGAKPGGDGTIKVEVKVEDGNGGAVPNAILYYSQPVGGPAIVLPDNTVISVDPFDKVPIKASPAGVATFYIHSNAKVIFSPRLELKDVADSTLVDPKWPRDIAFTDYILNPGENPLDAIPLSDDDKLHIQSGASSVNLRLPNVIWYEFQDDFDAKLALLVNGDYAVICPLEDATDAGISIPLEHLKTNTGDKNQIGYIIYNGGLTNTSSTVNCEVLITGAEKPPVGGNLRTIKDAKPFLVDHTTNIGDLGTPPRRGYRLRQFS
ncbi:hypothetical protein [Ochrobactrum sp. RH2CCR150]|uniref:hypothetical protein n=1 Tax=Ochrobactrum sp. RH2CCR150 TaxID=2587044 RepID=UPI0015FB88EF|nr:hypothetical protein [Ochrobactrum sp. RH2CCR150]